MATPVRLVLVLALAAAAAAYMRKPRWLKETKPEMWMSTAQLAKRFGYNTDAHTVPTSDGYLLVLHRILPANRTTGGIPILLGHGLCSCAEQWAVRGRKALIYQLVDMGFDIWLANYRGSFYSQKHQTLSKADHDFWDFSFHENGIVDQAESIDYVLKTTGREKMVVIGHSMSSTAQVVLLAKRPEYNDKLIAQILLAAPASFKHPTGLLAYTGKMMGTVSPLRNAAGTYVENDVFSGLDRPFPQACFTNFGGFRPRIYAHCKRLLDFGLGNLREPIDMYQLQLIMHHYPAGSSIRQVMHYAQCVTAGRFAEYDYGRDRNLELYGEKMPPLYNISNVRTPTYLIYSQGDGTVNYKDVEIFANKLEPGVLKELYKVPPKEFCHIDYLIAHDAEEIVYDYIKKYMEEIKNMQEEIKNP